MMMDEEISMIVDDDSGINVGDTSIYEEKPISVQSMAIFKIMRDDKEAVDSRTFIKNLMERINQKKSEEAEELEKKGKSVEAERKRAEIFNYTGCKKPYMEAYEQRISSESSAAEAYIENPSKQTRISTICFSFMDDGNVYAETTGTAWHLVNEISDEEFPKRISARILSIDGMIAERKKPLSGNKLSVEERSIVARRSDPTESPHIRTYDIADLRDDASIRSPKLNCLVRPNGKIKVVTSNCMVKFSAKIRSEGHKEFLNHLNKIYKGEMTMTTKGIREEDDNLAFRKYLKLKKKPFLNNIITGHIRKYMQNRDLVLDNELCDMEICKRSVLPFRDGVDFRVSYQRKSEKLASLPTLRNVLYVVRSKRWLSSGEPEQFANQMNQVYINYDYNGGTIRAKLMDLIEGYISHEGQTYFRYMSNDYYMEDDYVRQIHIEFQSFLHLKFLKATHLSEILKEMKDWTHGNEGQYNNLYMQNKYFLVGDDVTFGNIELFDLLYYNETTNKIYVIHVKSDLKNTTRELVAQMQASTNILKSFSIPRQQKDFEHYYSKIETKYSENDAEMPPFCSTFDKFLSVMSRKDFHIVCALSLRHKQGTRLRFESEDAKFRIDTNDLKNALVNFENYNRSEYASVLKEYETKENCVSSIFHELVNNGYVTDARTIGRVTDKLSTSLKDEVDFSITDGSDQSVDTALQQLLLSFVAGLSAMNDERLYPKNEIGIDDIKSALEQFKGNFNDFHRLLEEKFGTGDACSRNIFDALLAKGYVEDFREIGQVSTKLILSHTCYGENVKDGHSFTINNRENETLDKAVRTLLRNVITNYNSTAAKHALLQSHRDGYEFDIIEIAGYRPKQNEDTPYESQNKRFKPNEQR